MQLQVFTKSELQNKSFAEEIISQAWFLEPSLRTPKIRRLLAEIISLNFGVLVQFSIFNGKRPVAYELIISGYHSRVKEACRAFSDLSFETVKASKIFAKEEKERLKLEKKALKSKIKQGETTEAKLKLLGLKARENLFLQGFLLTILSAIKVTSLNLQDKEDLDQYFREHSFMLGINEVEVTQGTATTCEQELRALGREAALKTIKVLKRLTFN